MTGEPYTDPPTNPRPALCYNYVIRRQEAGQSQRWEAMHASHKVATFYPENWTAARPGDYVTYTSKNPALATVGDPMKIHDANTGALLVTGHVTNVDAEAWPARYEVRVNVNHAGGAA